MPQLGMRAVQGAHRASHTYEKVEASAASGCLRANPRIDAEQAAGLEGRHRQEAHRRRPHALSRANGAELISGEARVTGPSTVEVEDARGRDQETVEATRPSSSRPARRPSRFRASSSTARRSSARRRRSSLRDVPKRLLVIGGGVIGLELGRVYQKLGSELTVVEATPSLLPGVDSGSARPSSRSASSSTARRSEEHQGAGLRESKADGSLAVRVDSGGGKPETIVADVVLVAVGMRPNGAGLGLEEIGVKVERGFVPTDTVGRTNVPGIYAIGDVSGMPMLAHKATKEGEVVAEVIAGHKAAKDWVAIPAAIFTDPGESRSPA